MSAFINPWFIYDWVSASGAYLNIIRALRMTTLTLPTGYTWTFAAQCIICSFGLIPCYVFLQKYGARLRASHPIYLKHVDGLEVVAGSEPVAAETSGAGTGQGMQETKE